MRSSTAASSGGEDECDKPRQARQDSASREALCRQSTSSFVSPCHVLRVRPDQTGLASPAPALFLICLADAKRLPCDVRRVPSALLGASLLLTTNPAQCAAGVADSVAAYGEIRLGERRKTSKLQPSIFDGFSEYHEARRLAFEIGERDKLHEDVIFSDAMHVAVALALEDAGITYTMPNVAWMFGRVLPKDVRDILLLRRNYPDDYKSLPMAGATESLSSTEMNAAAELAKKLAPEQLDAFFFCDRAGNA